VVRGSLQAFSNYFKHGTNYPLHQGDVWTGRENCKQLQYVNRLPLWNQFMTASSFMSYVIDRPLLPKPTGFCVSIRKKWGWSGLVHFDWSTFWRRL